MNRIDLINNKILKGQRLYQMLNIWRFTDQKIVFTNGCFDLLHLGHIDYLSKAADMGNRLIIGLNSDSSTANLKGPSRPITDEVSRATLLAALFFVDAVILFDEETPLNLIAKVKPNILVKGADYSIDEIVGADLVIANGGAVKTINYLPGYSTTSIEQKIKNL
ncbi:MAG: D-heptose-phosphate adenylyltransferase [Sphingobacteriales bacterium]|nr:D-heptose-phosphate adenylyltransferase [Sphingobacteriales bacterium]